MKLTVATVKQCTLVNLKGSLKSRSDQHQRFVWSCNCNKNEIAKHCWEADHNFNRDQK